MVQAVELSDWILLVYAFCSRTDVLGHCAMDIRVPTYVCDQLPLEAFDAGQNSHNHAACHDNGVVADTVVHMHSSESGGNGCHDMTGIGGKVVAMVCTPVVPRAWVLAEHMV